MILSHLKPLIAELFDVDENEICPQTDFINDLYADSLDIVEFLMILEEEFDLENLDEVDLSQYHTVSDVVKFIEGRRGA